MAEIKKTWMRCYIDYYGSLKNVVGVLFGKLLYILVDKYFLNNIKH